MTRIFGWACRLVVLVLVIVLEIRGVPAFAKAMEDVPAKDAKMRESGGKGMEEWKSNLMKTSRRDHNRNLHSMLSDLIDRSQFI